MSYFVTGTDTGVGKTLVSCALLHALRVRGKRAVGMKPVAAGLDERGRNEDVEALCAASSFRAANGQVNPYAFYPPTAPHIAARWAGAEIGLNRIVESYRELAGQADCVVVEGVGGYCVPLNETEDTADLAVRLGLPVILVVGMRLGCLNHALLTARAIEASGLQCAGWVANICTPDMLYLQENIDALRQRLAAPLLGVIEYQPTPDAERAAAQLDMSKLDETDG